MEVRNVKPRIVASCKSVELASLYIRKIVTVNLEVIVFFTVTTIGGTWARVSTYCQVVHPAICKKGPDSCPNG